MITLIQKANNKSCMAAGSLLRKGCIVAFPTDTVYGLGAIYNDEQAIQKIFKAKGRDEKKPLSILVSDISQVELLAQDIPDRAKRLMEKYWPGALTLIFKKNNGIPDNVTAGGDTVGIRMPASETARKIIEYAGAPIAAPSANLSGNRSAVNAKDVLEDLNGRIDMLVDGGNCEIGISSTVVDITCNPVRIIRQGSITKSMIDEVLA